MNQDTWDDIRGAIKGFRDSTKNLKGSMERLWTHACDLDVKNQALTTENEALAKQAQYAVSLYSSLGVVISAAKETLSGANQGYFEERIVEAERLLKRFSDGVPLNGELTLATRLDGLYERIRYALLYPKQHNRDLMYRVDAADLQALVEIAKKYQNLVGAKL